MVLLKMLMEISLPKMVVLLVMMRTMISPSGREVPLAESLRQRAKVLLPKFHLETVALHPESPLLIFFWVKMTYIPEDEHRRWAEETTTHLGTPGPPGAPWCVVASSAHLRWPSSGICRSF